MHARAGRWREMTAGEGIPALDAQLHERLVVLRDLEEHSSAHPVLLEERRVPVMSGRGGAHERAIGRDGISLACVHGEIELAEEGMQSGEMGSLACVHGEIELAEEGDRVLDAPRLHRSALLGRCLVDDEVIAVRQLGRVRVMDSGYELWAASGHAPTAGSRACTGTRTRRVS